MKRAVLLVTMVLAGLAFAGCGDAASGGNGASPEAQVRGVVLEFIGAWKNGDGARACDLATDEYAAQMADETASDTCEVGLTAFAWTISGYEPEVLEVRVTGETATAVLPEQESYEETTYELSKGESGWLIAGEQGKSTDHNDRVIEEASEEGEAVEAAEAEVLGHLRQSLTLKTYSGVDNAFRLPNGHWCSIDEVFAGDPGYTTDDMLVSPDGETAVQVNYFIAEDAPDSSVKAECLRAVLGALDW